MEVEWTEVYAAARDVIITLFSIFAIALLTALKSAIEKKLKTSEELENYKKMQKLAEIAVASAEQKYKSLQQAGLNLPDADEFKRNMIDLGQQKKEYAMTLLRSKLPDMDTETLDAAIEAAVVEFRDWHGATSNLNVTRSTENPEVQEEVVIRGQDIRKGFND